MSNGMKDKLDHLAVDWDKDELWKELQSSIPSKKNNYFYKLIGLALAILVIGGAWFLLSNLTITSDSKENRDSIVKAQNSIAHNPNAHNPKSQSTKAQALNPKPKIQSDYLNALDSNSKSRVHDSKYTTRSQHVFASTDKPQSTLLEPKNTSTIKRSQKWNGNNSYIEGRNQGNTNSYLMLKKETHRHKEDNTLNSVKENGSNLIVNRGIIADKLVDRTEDNSLARSNQTNQRSVLPIPVLQDLKQEVKLMANPYRIEYSLLPLDNNHTKWYVEGLAQIGIVKRNSSTTDMENELDILNNRSTVKPLFYTSYGINVGRKFSNGWLLSSGLALDCFYEELDKTYIAFSETNIELHPEAFYISNPYGNPNTFVTGLTNITTENQRKIVHLNRLNTVSIPITIGYSRPIGNSSWQVSGGVDIHLNTRYTGKWIDINNDIITDINVENTLFGYHFGIAYYKPISNTISIGINTSYKYSPKYMIHNTINTYYTFYIGLGVRYEMKK